MIKTFCRVQRAKGLFCRAIALLCVRERKDIESMDVLFPFSEYWWFYLSFVGLVLVLLALDLGVFHRKAHAVGFREAATWTIVWISLALLFNLLLYQYALWKFPQDARLMAIPGLGVVLVFVGLKMVWLNDLFGGKFPIKISLGVISFVIAMSIVLSLLFPKRRDRISGFTGLTG
jgi:hypothetical protein